MPISTLFVNRSGDPEANMLLMRLQRQGYPLNGLVIERVFRLEGDKQPDVGLLEPLLVNSRYERSSSVSQLDETNSPVIEISYQPAVTDPETPSILDGARALGNADLTWARLGQRFQLIGVTPDVVQKIADAHLFNNVVQMIVTPDYEWKKLRPTGTPGPVQTISLEGLDDDALLALSYKHGWEAPLSQLKVLQRAEKSQGRPFFRCEIEVILQSWCDHCYHLTWKRLGLFKLLRSSIEEINHPLVVSVLTDNAGGMLFYDGWVICIKGETHNHPSAIATYGGIMTKHGGIDRDIMGFGKGGYPIGGSTIMGTMDPRMFTKDVPPGALHPLTILLEAIRGTADYCNPMGIPMMLPQYRIHPNYPKCFALGHAIGIIPEEHALKEDPKPGDIALLIGGRTGRDGIHGANLSSSEMGSDEITRSAASVQIGHPIVERNFMTGIPVLRDNGCVRAMYDLGAGGISCAAGESGETTGIEIYLDRVPLKDASLSDWEIAISESQERMLVVVPPEKLQLALEICHQYNIEATNIGNFTDTHRYVVYCHGKKVVDLDMGFLWNSCPIDPIEVREPERKLTPATAEIPDTPDQWSTAAIKVVSHYHCCDQSAAGFQFDATVQGRTAIGPYGGKDGNMPTNAFVSVPLRGKPYGTVFTSAYNPFYGDVDPKGLGRLMVVEAISKAIALGVNPREIVLCDNFYTPKLTPETGWCLKTLAESAINFSEALGIPFVSGKDSSSGTFAPTKTDVPYTFVCSTLSRVLNVQNLVTKPFKHAGNQLVLVGLADAERLGGSVYLDCNRERGDKLPDWGFEWANQLRAMWKQIHSAQVHSQPAFKAASAVAEGGLFMKLFEMALGSRLGARVNLQVVSDGRLDGNLFGEHIGCLLFEIDQRYDPATIFGGLPWRSIGTVTGDQSLSFTSGRERLFDIPMQELCKPWEQTFKEVVQ